MMGKNFMLLRAFLLLSLVAIHASSCKQEEYWKMKLPSVPIPNAVRDNLLHSDEKEKQKLTINQPYTVGSWKYNEGEEKEKFIINQPYTVGSWKYNVEKEREKTTINQPYTVFAWKYNKEKEKEKTIINQPYTVGSWKYNDEKEKEKPSLNQPFTVFAWKYNEQKEKEKPTINQPYTVGSWNYKSNKENEDAINQPFTIFAWKYNEEKEKEKPTINQPYTVGSWKYKSNKENEDAINQPYTVFAWKYNEQKEKEKPTINQPYTVGSWKYKSNKENKDAINQPYTVFAWKYNEEKEKEKPTINQPYTVFAWKYNEEKEKEKSTINQPYTVGSWKYKSNKENEDAINQPYTVGSWKYTTDDMKSNNHMPHGHFMHHSSTPNDNSVLGSNKLEEQDHYMIGGSIFFVEKNLRVGMKQRHDFQKSGKVGFWPRNMVESIPFTVDKFPQILKRLSINPQSSEATAIKDTLTTCLERPKVQKENRTCAQSLEGIVDFVIQELGSDNVKVRVMDQQDDEIPTGMQEYEVTKVDKLDIPGNNGVACHKMVYPYAVYWCHHQQDIGQYSVTLVNSKGIKVDTTAVCHYDTYAWNPDVPALKYLKIRPGDAPVCHFSGINDMFWSLNSSRSITLDAAQ